MADVATTLKELAGRIGVWDKLSEGVAQLFIGDEAPWFIELRRGAAPVVGQDARDARCSLRASADTWQALFTGRLSPNAALLNQSLEVEGDLALAQTFMRTALRTEP